MTKSRFSIKSLTVSLAVAFSSAVAHAHPGHSLTQATPTHLLTSPYHIMTLALIGGGLWLGAFFVKRLVARRAMQIGGAAAIIATAAAIAHQMLA